MNKGLGGQRESLHLSDYRRPGEKYYWSLHFIKRNQFFQRESDSSEMQWSDEEKVREIDSCSETPPSAGPA